MMVHVVLITPTNSQCLGESSRPNLRAVRYALYDPRRWGRDFEFQNTNYSTALPKYWFYPGSSGAPRGLGDLGRMAIYLQGAGDHC